MTTILKLCKCILRRLDAILATLKAIEAQSALAATVQAQDSKRLDLIESTLAKIDSAVEEDEPQAAGFKIAFVNKE